MNLLKRIAQDLQEDEDFPSEPDWTSRAVDELGTRLKIGDIVEDYGGNKYRVIVIGTWEKVKKYDSTGATQFFFSPEQSDCCIATLGLTEGNGFHYVFTNGPASGTITKVGP